MPDDRSACLSAQPREPTSRRGHSPCRGAPSRHARCRHAIGGAFRRDFQRENPVGSIHRSLSRELERYLGPDQRSLPVSTAHATLRGKRNVTGDRPARPDSAYTGDLLGGRKTHEYPVGKPSPLVLIDIAMSIVCVSWVAFASHGWPYVLGILAVFLALAVIASTLTRSYERSGLAVRIPRVAAVGFTKGTPAPVRALRVAVFVLVVALLFFGFAPFPSTVAKRWIIGSVIGLLAVGVVHSFLERHYVNTGRAEELYDRPSRG
jgi:hypothetical protein